MVGDNQLVEFTPKVDGERFDRGATAGDLMKRGVGHTVAISEPEFGELATALDNIL